MVFNSLTFVVFFAIVLLVHNLPLAWPTRKVNLLIASYLSYASWNPPFLILLWGRGSGAEGQCRQTDTNSTKGAVLFSCNSVILEWHILRRPARILLAKEVALASDMPGRWEGQGLAPQIPLPSELCRIFQPPPIRLFLPVGEVCVRQESCIE